ncbi:myosin-2-like [Rhododendron vialii]|uniref:myosin-2-like n=1 Tax=Rhododendron vialii TaxID=182163 RepID=UPI00265DB80D|nr:myosin-2-like [Rhododendron vialii]
MAKRLTSTRSSLELMLDSLMQKDEQLPDVPPALPSRPVSRARLPSARRAVQLNVQKFGLRQDLNQIEGRKKGECGIKNGFVLSKIELPDLMNDTRERVLEIQRYFRGHQARCYYLKLKGGAIILQSFVRGESSRKDYLALSRRLAAIIVIQQHTKKWIEWRTAQKKKIAIICLQSVIRGWLTRLNCKENFRLLGTKPMEDMRTLDWRNPETKDYVQVSPSAIADLQSRLLRAETELGIKEEENAAIRQQLQKFDKKWSHYEAKMNSMEKIWQDQLTSLQISLAAAKKSLTSKCITDQPVIFDPFPLYPYHGADASTPLETNGTDGRIEEDIPELPCDTEPQQRNRRLNDNTQPREQCENEFHGNSSIDSELKSASLASSIAHDEELRKLKLKFETWKKDYKTRLQETTTMLQKVGHSEAKKSRKKWWK